MALIEKYKKVNQEVDTELNKRKQITSELERAEASLAKARSEDNKELQKLKLQTQEANKEAKLQAQLSTSQEGSLKKLRAELILLTSQYDKLSAAERKEASGKELEAKIQTLTKEISGLEQTTGRFQRNVGNYESALKGFKGNIADVKSNWAGLGSSMAQFKSGDVSGGILSIQSSLKGLGSSLMSLLVSPVGLAVAAITSIIIALNSWYDYNEKISSQTGYLKKAIGTQGETLKALRSDIQATAETMKVGFMEVAKTINKYLDLGLVKDEFTALAGIQKGLLQTTDKNKFLSDLENNAVAAKNLGMNLDQVRGMLLAAEKNGTDVNAIFGALQKGTQTLAIGGEKVKASFNAAFGKSFTDDLFGKIKTGQISTSQALQMVSDKSEKVGLNVSQQAELAKEMFGKSAIAAGGYEMVLRTVADSLELQNKKLSPLQESNLKLTELTALQERAWAGLFDQTGGGFEKMKVDFKLMTAKYILEFIQWIYKAVNGFIDLYNESNIFRATITGIGVAFKNSFGFSLLLIKEIWIGLKALGSDAVDIFTQINKAIDNLKSGNFKAAANDINSITTKLAINHIKQFNESKKAVKDYANDVKNNMKSVSDAYNSTSKLKHFEIPKVQKEQLTKNKGKNNPYSDDSNDLTAGELAANKKSIDDKKKTSEQLKKIAYENAKAEIEARKISLEYSQKFWNEEIASAEEKKLFYENYYYEQFSLLEAEKKLELSNAKTLGERNKIIEKFNLDRLNLEKQQADKLKSIKLESIQNSENQYKLSNESILDKTIDLTDKLVENEKNRINKILDFELELLNKKFDLTEKEIQNKLDAGEILTKAELEYLSAVKEARKKANKEITDLDSKYTDSKIKILQHRIEVEKLLQGKGYSENIALQIKHADDSYKIAIEKLQAQLQAKQITQRDYDNAAEEEKIKRDATIQQLDDDFWINNLGKLGEVYGKQAEMQQFSNATLALLRLDNLNHEALTTQQKIDLKWKELDAQSAFLGALGGLFGKQTEIFKAFMVVQATMDAFAGAHKAYINSLANPMNALLPDGGLLKAKIAYGIALTFGLAKVAAIAFQKAPKYKDGTLYAERSGTAVTDEEGPELHFDKNWKLKDRGSSGGARFKQVAQGDKIIPADITKMINSLSIPLSNISKIQNNQNIDYGKLSKMIAKETASENMRALENQKKEYFIPGINGEIIKVETQNGMTTIIRKTEPKPTGQILQ